MIVDRSKYTNITNNKMPQEVMDDKYDLTTTKIRSNGYIIYFRIRRIKKAIHRFKQSGT